MINGSRWKAVLLLAAVLAAGVALGWLGNERVDGSRKRGSRSAERVVERLTKELSLSDAQRDSVRVIIDRRRVDIDSLWAEVHPRFDAVRARTHTEIEHVLTPAQTAKYRAWNEAREQKRREHREESMR